MNKLGTLVIGSARSGSHPTCASLFDKSNIPNKILLSELNDQIRSDISYLDDISKNNYFFASLVQFDVKIKYAKFSKKFFDQYHLVNIRRRDKVAQYLSWCVYRLQQKHNLSSYSANANFIKPHLPWIVTPEDLDMFICEQIIDYAFEFDEILYYEDLVKNNFFTKFGKNYYGSLSASQIVSDLDLVVQTLGDFQYRV